MPQPGTIAVVVQVVAITVNNAMIIWLQPVTIAHRALCAWAVTLTKPGTDLHRLREHIFLVRQLTTSYHRTTAPTVSARPKLFEILTGFKAIYQTT